MALTQDFTERALDVKPEDSGLESSLDHLLVCDPRLPLLGTKSEKGQESAL